MCTSHYPVRFWRFSAIFLSLYYNDFSIVFVVFVYFLFLDTCIKKYYELKGCVCISGVFESHGTLVVPNVSVIAPEKLSASARRRQEIQVHTLQISIPK